MNFVSYHFVIFFVVCLIVKNLTIISWKSKKISFLLLSYLFYASFFPQHLILLILLTLFNFLISYKIKEKFFYYISIFSNLAVLVFYKYISFLIFDVFNLNNLFGLEKDYFSSIILPIGISFYVFEIISYHTDCFLNKFERRKSLLDFSLYIAFFPRLAAGPIIRPHEFFPEIDHEKYIENNKIFSAFFMIFFGLFQKIVFADFFFKPIADKYFAQNIMDSWAGLMAFSGQIYCDFAGYSLCAIGLASLLGIKIPQNFNAPYTAVLFSDFWQRWHISLSRWFRDYVYIPLGGNRKGLASHALNLLITMALCGLWHGASFSFIIWGALHAVFLILEKLFWLIFPKEKVYKSFLLKLVLASITLYCVSIAWIFFRIPDIDKAINSLYALHKMGNTDLSSDGILVLCVFSLMIFIQILERRFVWTFKKIKIHPVFQLSFLFIATILITISSMGNISGFIYFKF